MLRHKLIYLIPLLLIFAASCEKKEPPITLPAQGPAVQGQVGMGEDYGTMVYYDFERNEVVKSSPLESWDLAFQAGTNDHHVFMNGGRKVFVYNTHETTFTAIKSSYTTPPAKAWKFDAACGLPDSTGIGEWTNGGGISKGEVYLVQLFNGDLKKIRLVSVTTQKYVIEYGDVDATTPVTLDIPKNPDYNFTYFSFTQGVTNPEPPKGDWDVVFMYYRHVFYDQPIPTPYPVCGVLLNPYGTSAAVDSTTGFAQITLSTALAAQPSYNRDAIGYNWKTYDRAGGRYTVNPQKVYLVHTRNGKLLKMHFLDFYSNTGVKGDPAFESQIF